MHLIHVFIIQNHFTLAGSTLNQFMHPVNAAQISCLTTTGRAHHRYDIVFRNINIYILHHMIGSEVSIEIPAFYNCTFHLFVVSLVIIFKNNTVNNKIKAAPQAISCQSS